MQIEPVILETDVIEIVAIADNEAHPRLVVFIFAWVASERTAPEELGSLTRVDLFLAGRVGLRWICTCFRTA